MALSLAIMELEKRLAQTLARFPADSSGWIMILPQPIRLAETRLKTTAMFDEGVPPEPPSQARINALDRLRRNVPGLPRKDWELIASGLCDECGRAGRPIEDVSLFSRIMHYVDAEIEQGTLSRKVWFGLLRSYFAYPQIRPEDNPNWMSLRNKLFTSLPGLIKGQLRPKAWTRAMQNQCELLTDKAGHELGKALFEGKSGIVDEVAMFLPIPESSWLWRRVVIEQLRMLFRVDDATFVTVIPNIIALAKKHTHQTDDVLSALLTRYSRSTMRHVSHPELKDFAQEQWQSPQVKSSNRWSVVDDDVRKMVLQWFARADLEHFFSLLQGVGGVDRERLDYWLRFVDQIGYTRIVMGVDAFQNRDPNFADFRLKNKGRFSQLQGGDSANNAFVMRIGDYYFVEFSNTGNACYVYPHAGLPFNPEDKRIIRAELRRPNAATDRIIHNGDWAYKADRLLSSIGIFPDIQRRTARTDRAVVTKNEWQPLANKNEPVVTLEATHQMPRHETQINANTASPSSRSASAVLQSATAPGSLLTQNQATLLRELVRPASGFSRGDSARMALELVETYKLRHTDMRSSGGPLWIFGQLPDSELGRRLIELNFQYRPTIGHCLR